MDSRDLSDEQLERISARLAQRIRRRRRLVQAVAVTIAGVAGAVLSAGVLTAVTTDRGTPVAASVTCWEQDGQGVALSGEIRTPAERSTASLAAACAALTGSGADGGTADGTDAAQYSLAGSQVCQEDGQIRIFTGLTSTVDCTNPPATQTGVDQ
ncbi:MULTISPECIES: hypothetical protein [unclassified Rathayibacter]|uniref:hypothetical protein n=1 Tax=unclassified Rathayibacter TaxID=2609250 RepID=UPI000CE8A869|nr:MULTISPECIES: hypothetical protein [unclassified Rathayibacter]PPF14099.1 hypothetical protein C5B92_15405 [Rathayibacter sp. AY1A4]PPG76792.1 hypothetical protein C5C52_14950 [Rathayibacter sp. AY1E5]PPH26605.1 hypothetical protein C5C94_16725 [Rathayibacter sp. AY1C3]PPH59340.1 hypothetical protein C5D25_12870 [Rathayibacter sp. AY1D7]PPI26480.1 hypothetical protein C5D66_16630 [Rathayibacter sp. AY1B4]